MRRGRPCTALGPTPRDFVLLADAGLVAEPDFYWLATRLVGDSRHDGREVFLKAATAAASAGISADAVLSVPTGGRDKGDDDQDRGLAYVGDALDAGLKRVKQFVLCVDADAKGHGLREALAVILGKVRVWFVDWPEGLKDANDMLLSDGPEALRELVVDGALEWPVRGLYRLSQLPEVASIQTWNPGFPEWDGRVKLAPGMLSVVTGFPGHGKSQFRGSGIDHRSASSRDRPPLPRVMTAITIVPMAPAVRA